MVCSARLAQHAAERALAKRCARAAWHRHCRLEDGVLKPAQPLPLREHEQVQITVHSRVKNLADAYGLMGFQGTAEEADYFATDPELGYPPTESS